MVRIFIRFRAKEDGCVKVVMFPHGARAVKIASAAQRQKQPV